MKVKQFISTKKETTKTRGIWRTNLEEIYTKHGLKLNLENKIGAVVMLAPRHYSSVKQQQNIQETKE